MSDFCETNIADDLPEGSVITGRVEIVTYMTPDSDDYFVGAKSCSNGDNLPLITSYGMLELAKDLLLEAHDS